MVNQAFSLPAERRPYRSWVEISLPQIAANYRSICSVVGPQVEVMAIVKADAYRHGAIEVSRTLASEGALWLAVSSTEEGVALRDAGIRTRILVMADFLPFTRETLFDQELTPVIHSLADLQELDRLAASRAPAPLPFHLKIDTGMGRLGVRAGTSAIVEAIESARHVRLEGLMTHFASAGNYEKTQTEEQTALFESIAAALTSAGIRPQFTHLSSTIPVAYGQRSSWGGQPTGAQPMSRPLVRPGHSIYGYVSPAKGRQQVLEVKPALTWRASVLSIKDIPAGALVGYGGIFQAPRPMRIAVLAAGYADGIPHRLSNRGNVIVKGRLVRILGAVSMDLTTIDVSAIPGLQVGDPVTLLGSEGAVSIDAQQIARTAGTISYSVLCGIHARVKRLYL